MDFAHVLTVYRVEYEDETGEGFDCWQLGFPQVDFWQVKALTVGLYVPQDGYIIEGSAYAPIVRRINQDTGARLSYGLKDAIVNGYLTRVEKYEAPVRRGYGTAPATTGASPEAA